jgi:hypothetical protein
MLDGRNCNSDMQIRQGHWYPQAAPHESGTAQADQKCVGGRILYGRLPTA